jgi:ParB-like chromosome segregation protein Spo0J
MAEPPRLPTDDTVPDPETAEVPDAAYIVIAGRHRLEAYRKLGLQHIPAIVRNCSELEDKLGETAERAAEPRDGRAPPPERQRHSR